tara:strand:- start:160 stop:567 length:408 start_codon:yes stop_codon:yes gene_type:complete
MGPWWLYFLVFIFGYITCKTFYFARASRISLSLMLYTQIIYLSTMVKILESLLQIKYFSAGIRKSTKEMAPVCNQIDKKVEREVAILKDNSINYLINMHPKFYRENLKFEDWDSSMRFLKEKKQEAFNFWKHDHD